MQTFYIREYLNDMYATCSLCKQIVADPICHYPNIYCLKCAKHLKLKQCNKCKSWHYTNKLIHFNNKYFCEICADKLGYAQCDHCKKIVKNIRKWDCSQYCNACYKKLISKCKNCDRTTLNSNLIEGLCRFCFDNDNFTCDEWHLSDDFSKIKSTRVYGLELETHKCLKYKNLKRHPAWGAKCDESVCGKEFFSSKLRGDCGLEAIKDLCKLARENKWKTNKDCGFHLHIDLSKEPAKNLKAVAYAYNRTIDVWRYLVNNYRSSNNDWCAHTEYGDRTFSRLNSKDDWARFSSWDTQRYTWINWQAYSKFGSLEIRSHEGTLNKRKIWNWIRAHLIFVDWAASIGIKNVKEILQGDANIRFNELCKIWLEAGCYDLPEYYAKKSLVGFTINEELLVC